MIKCLCCFAVQKRILIIVKSLFPASTTICQYFLALTRGCVDSTTRHAFVQHFDVFIWVSGPSNLSKQASKHNAWLCAQLNHLTDNLSSLVNSLVNSLINSLVNSLVNTVQLIILATLLAMSNMDHGLHHKQIKIRYLLMIHSRRQARTQC